MLIVMADTAVSAIAGGRIRELPSKRFNRTRLHHAHVPVRSLVAPPPSPAGEPSYSWAFCTVTALTVLVMAWYVRVLRRSSAARFTVLAKRGCLLVAVIQNSFGVMWFRYSRITPECRDDPAAVVVLYGEILKLGACLFLLMLRGPKGLHIRSCGRRSGTDRWILSSSVFHPDATLSATIYNLWPRRT